MNLNNPYNTKLTPENANDYVGREILFNYNGAIVKRTLLKVSKCRKTIYVDHPETNNFLQLGCCRIVITVIDDELAEAALQIPVLQRESARECIFPVCDKGEFIGGVELHGDVVCELVENTEEIAALISEFIMPPYLVSLNDGKMQFI